MDHFYKRIVPNWMDYEPIYTRMVNEFGDGSHFVEVGSHMGRSAAYMAVEIINSGKNIKFDCIDSFTFYDGYEKNPDIFHKNLEPVSGHYNLIVDSSPGAADRYSDESLDFVWIDAAHKYEDVYEDIKTWYPKVKIGGYICGHDWPGDPDDISRAVSDNNLGVVLYHGSMTASWIHCKG